MVSMSQRMQIMVAVVVGVGMLLFGSGLSNEFAWDDEEQVVNNPVIASLQNVPAFFQGSTFQTGGAGGLSGLYYKPLMTLSYALINAAFGLEAFYFHAVQALLHIINALLVFWFIRLVLRRVEMKQLMDYWAFGAAMIFLIHPVQVESVVYTASFQEVLFFLFGIIALLLLSVGQPKNRWQMMGLVGLVGLLQLASLLSKESGVLFGPMVLVMGVYFGWRVLPLLIGEGVAAAVYAYLRFFVAQVWFRKHNLSPITRADFLERMKSVPEMLVYYGRLLVWPKNLAIAQHWMVTKLGWLDFWLPLLGSAVVLGLVGWWGWHLFIRRSKWRWVWTVFMIWTLVGISLHMQLLPLDMTVAERWLYFPLVGVTGLIVVGFEQIYERGILFSYRLSGRSRMVAMGVFIAIVIALSARSYVRIGNWQDGYTLYGHDVALAADSFDLQNNYGVELYRHQEYEEAKLHFARSTELAAHWWTNWNNLGVSVERDGDKQTALAYYARSIENGDYYLAYQNKARLLFQTGQIEEAAKFTEEALLKLPYNEQLWQVRLVALQQLGDQEGLRQARARIRELQK